MDERTLGWVQAVRARAEVRGSPNRDVIALASREWHSVSPESPIACHAEAVREGRSILLCRLRLRRGALAFAWPFPRLRSSSVTNSTGFLLLFGSGRIALAPFLALLTQLFLVQIGLVLFIGKTTA